ncbi:alpha-1,4-glucan--maltose-1-phosphate maltosyltransferase [Roseisolibacter sp. H3M3-2]|uniref:alpha-1,4-glucan--maltose-1-phosphate maltosyltransferase n=1 Tax=Roseisolibacter sp. H3M3-2 TaxID=3031323 RepID=UPI0023DB9F6E|nr:alpha-1,4-glucan--maltose-1-phosphate maltosyltransferase [Roseisolibacter sp. H3M3-2]MDF1504662.1 alpha-1,4-glucan--maltose-1-phosphate maltosyltransferase [Roseisolibacter sp. H3M3-2]
MTASRPAPARRAPARRAGDATLAPATAPRLVIASVTPAVDGGRFPAKRVTGEPCVVGADVFREGHDLLRARIRYRGPGDAQPRTAPMTLDPATDRWEGEFALDAVGRWSFTVEAWTDEFATWRERLAKRVAAQQPEVVVELLVGAAQLQRGDCRAPCGAARPLEERVAAAQDDELAALMATHAPPSDLTTYERELPLLVERPSAAFASWYEFFPRSTSPEPGRHGTFADAEAWLPRIAELGFDVVYLPPIHPIGHTFRKGRNNTLTPEPGDVGSPWAIGNEHGGHTAVEPALGTLADFERFVQRANALGLEVALDYALQCSPDHPWVKEHPDWFVIRPDGTIAYAENPPKKYQDIYPLDFWSQDRDGLWAACRDALRFWIERGVKTFRVDNPHTKPFAFWEWAIAEVRREHPDVVFLSEAFTKPKKLLHLAKLGFSQSYGYFTWKNADWEIRQWLDEFLAPDVVEYHRGNMFVNTPDILHEFLQTGGRGAFRLRLLLAGTLSPLYGVYSGYELLEHEPVRPGSEEYLDSEKYQLRHRDFARPGNLDADMARLNRIRRAEPALQRQDNLTFHPSDNPNVLFYRRAGVRGSADLLVAVNLDPRNAHATMVHVPIDEMHIDEGEPYEVEDLLTGARYTWRGSRNYVRLDPAHEPAHVLRVAPRPPRPKARPAAPAAGGHA